MGAVRAHPRCWEELDANKAPVPDASQMSRNIVVCSDGTGNTFDSRVTNVTRLVKNLVLDNPKRQLVIYDQGVGTTARREKETRASGQSPALRMLPAPEAGKGGPIGWIARGRGLISGYGLKENIRQMYLALAEEYHPSDQLFLFGFSRGAFTVRALAGLLHRCHLPQPDSPDLDERFERSWDLFQPMVADTEAVEALRHENRPCPVHFLGVWDTVKSYGGLKPVILPHLRHNPDVANVRHALALEERRAWFKHTTWGQLDIDQDSAMTRVDLEDLPAYERQDIGEVWFSGCHSDVGGGGAETATSRIALRWMLAEAAAVDPPLLPNDHGRALLRSEDPRGPLPIKQSWTLSWRAMELIPRCEINNEGVYPVTERHRGSDGVRDPYTSRRGDKVRFHASVVNPPSVDAEIVPTETKTWQSPM